MDIDDILNTLNDHSGIPQETRDLQQLTRLWVIERSAPEILRWPEALMDRVLDRIRKQVRPCPTCNTALQDLGIERSLIPPTHL